MRTDIEQIVAHLSGCLALVRPVGMSDEQADEWLTVAAQSLGGFSLSTIAGAASVARRKCRHHSEIVPAIVAECEEATKPDPFAMPEHRLLPKPRVALTQEQFDQIVAERSLALSCALDMGLIVSDGQGNFALPSDHDIRTHPHFGDTQ